MAFTPFRDMTPTEQAVWDRITADRPTGDFKAASGTGWKSDPSKSVHDDMNDWLVSRGEKPLLPQLQIDTDNDPPGFPSNTPDNYARLRQAQIEAAAEGIPLLLDKGFRLIRPGDATTTFPLNEIPLRQDPVGPGQTLLRRLDAERAAEVQRSIERGPPRRRGYGPER